MSNQKNISRLSLVVIALLAAALPALAQTKSTQTRNDQTGDSIVTPATEIAALGSERLNVYKAEAKPWSEAMGLEQKQSHARARFQQSIEAASSASPAFLTTISESDWQKTRQLGNDESSTSAKRITFVPSRGQKLPQ